MVCMYVRLLLTPSDDSQAHLPARQASLGTIISAQGSFCSDFSGFITIDDKGIGKGST